MYPPPSKDTLSKLKGSPVDLVTFGRYMIRFSFENGNLLTAAAPSRFSTVDLIADAAIQEFPILESNLMRLLSHSIDEISCDSDGTLELTFSNRDMLILYANDPMYEAYTLLIDGREYVV